jgi:uncharacterized protein YdeI (YjbR/CyaY-like superfamily)
VASDPAEAVFFPSAADFRAWLEANHDSAPELWVGYHKKSSGRGGMTYAEAVDEALCFGWIDGKVRSLDEDSYVQRYTPRRPDSNWSAVNIAKVAALKEQGRMHPAGLRAFEQRDVRRDAAYSYERREAMPPDLEARLRADARAWAYWQAETPSYRRGVIHWLLEAKRDETRERRLTDLISDSGAMRRIKPYRYFEAPQRAASKP